MDTDQDAARAAPPASEGVPEIQRPLLRKHSGDDKSAARLTVPNKRKIKYLFWGGANKSPVPKRKDLVKEVCSLKSEIERLQSECTNARRLYTQLKIERLADLTKKSRERSRQRKVIPPDAESQSCQTDPPALINHFKKKQIKNCVFIYDVVALTTQQFIPKAKPRATSLEPELRGIMKEEESKTNSTGADGATVTGVDNSTPGGVWTQDFSFTPDSDPTMSASAKQPGILTSRGTPLPSRSSSPSKIYDMEALPQVPPGCPKSFETQNNNIAESPTATFNKLSDEVAPLSLTFDVKDTEFGKDLTDPLRPSMHMATTHCSNLVVRSDCGVTSFDARSQKSPSALVSGSLLENADIRTFSSCDSSVVEPNAEDLRLMMQDTTLEDEAIEPKVIPTPAPESPLPPSLQSALFHKLKQALSLVATEEKELVRQVPEEVPKTLNEEPVHGSRQFLSLGGQGETAVTRDPGLREFQKRCLVSDSSRALPPVKIHSDCDNVVSDTVQLDDLTQKQTIPNIEMVAPQAAGGSSALPQCKTPTAVGAEEPVLPPTPLFELPSISRVLLKSPSEEDSLSEELKCNGDGISEEESRRYETSSEFHASVKNVLRAAVEKRTTADQSANSKTSNKNGSKADRRKKRKKSKRKRDTLRRAESLSTASTSEGSAAEARGKMSVRGKKSAASDNIRTLSDRSRQTATAALPYSTGKSSQGSDAYLRYAHLSEASSGVSSSGTSVRQDHKLFRGFEKAPSDQSQTTRPPSNLRGTSTVQSPGSPLAPAQSKTGTEMSPSDEKHTQSRHFLSENQNKESSEGYKRSFFESLSSAGYLPFDDDATMRRPTVVVDNRRQYLSDEDCDSLGDARGLAKSLQTSCGVKADPSEKSYAVQRSCPVVMPFPREIMKTLLPSFVNLDGCSRVDKITPNMLAFEKSSATTNPDAWLPGYHPWTEIKDPALPKESKPVNWEEVQSCLLPAFYSFGGNKDRQRGSGKCCHLRENL
ncbi:unnamed protein product [Ixodes pacificus]